MGKTEKNKSTAEESLHKTKKQTESTDEATSYGAALRAIKMPTTAAGLTAENLTSEQKVIFKKHCQNMYGHQYSKGKRKLPASTIESATLQLAAKMKAKQEQRNSKQAATANAEKKQ